MFLGSSDDKLGLGANILYQQFLNFTGYQNYLKGSFKHRLLGLTLRVSDSLNLGKDPKICHFRGEIYAVGPHFENHYNIPYALSIFN